MRFFFENGDNKNYYFNIFSNAIFNNENRNLSPALNERFIEFIKRAVRNLLLDDQSAHSVVDGWKALAGLLKSSHYESDNMYFSSILANVNTISDIRNNSAYGSKALQTLFEKNLGIEQASYLANIFDKLSRDKEPARTSKSCTCLMLIRINAVC